MKEELNEEDLLIKNENLVNNNHNKNKFLVDEISI